MAATDRHFMDVALMLGRRGQGRTGTNPAVGAVIVRDGVVVGRGWTQPGGRPHAEIAALTHAAAAARGATLYVTLEPCSHHGKTPPCADAIIAAGIARVVSVMEDPNPAVAGAGHARLRAAGLAVDIGLGADEARLAHGGHIARVLHGRPHVILKLAVSADGKIAGSGGARVTITGEAAQARVHLLRARTDAILIGSGTALADDPELTCRLPGMAARSPIRVVLDRRARLPLTSRLVTTARATPLWLYTASPGSAEAQALAAQGVIIGETKIAAATPLDDVLADLSRCGVNRLLVEGGATMAAAFIAADRVDEAWLFHAPLVIGAAGVPALADLPLDALTHAPQLRIHGEDRVGGDRLTIYRRREG